MSIQSYNTTLKRYHYWDHLIQMSYFMWINADIHEFWVTGTQIGVAHVTHSRLTNTKFCLLLCKNEPFWHAFDGSIKQGFILRNSRGALNCSPECFKESCQASDFIEHQLLSLSLKMKVWLRVVYYSGWQFSWNFFLIKRQNGKYIWKKC